jgi:membrane protein implicated in regulation of membrane protease activity
LILEIVVFLSVSLALWYFTRPIVIKYFCSGDVRKGYDGVIGKEATVIVTVDKENGTGKVDVDGQEWSAKCPDEVKLEMGCKVIVKGISGAKLIVQKNTD